jgi:hypothetical protein
MKAAAILLALPALAVQFTVTPAVVTQCVDGLGQVTLNWSDAGIRPVQVHLFSSSGPPITGWDSSRGSTATGVWVPDGMVFVLADETGAELARVTARVHCGALVDPPGNTSYWPLAVGNHWIFRYDSRMVTSDYERWVVTGNEERNGRLYAVLQRGPEPWRVREGEGGRVYRLLDTGVESLVLDPAAGPAAGAVSTPAGDFGDAAAAVTIAGGLLREESTFARGLGPVRTHSTLMTGSSGGFTEGRQLAEALINGRLWRAPGVRLEATVESSRLDVSGRNVTNCAVPCYFVACGLAPGADPPGTYKPCFQTRVATSGAPTGAVAWLELLDGAGAAVVSRKLALDATGTVYFQCPLYTQPNVAFAPGDYHLRVRLLDAQGGEWGLTSLGLRIE